MLPFGLKEDSVYWSFVISVELEAASWRNKSYRLSFLYYSTCMN